MARHEEPERIDVVPVVQVLLVGDVEREVHERRDVEGAHRHLEQVHRESPPGVPNPRPDRQLPLERAQVQSSKITTTLTNLIRPP